ncbi:GntR family transcriptional regulator [Labrys miyagiensis]|uniref:GntR family transcriptional regulator n=1 Tax=Labrys miyagiensis TaxID=346912 RepID=A0ABQ6CUU1_9HYPH|nr:GntR family transcriptional regulator [Labrys miyagiensis]GLS24122.1 GntR family transcriptional regulator [Labrys miyagiensis]
MSSETLKESEEDGLGFAVEIDRKHPVADQIYDALKRAIITTRLLPGTSISENRICRHFGVSRTPVRSAVTRLSEEGLIDVYPQQGSFVSPIRLGEVRDSHFVRKNLELALLREAAAKWSPALSAQARAIVEVQRQALAAGDIDRFFEEDENFHQAFAAFAAREGVWSTVLQAKSRLARFVRLFGTPSRLPVVLDEHLIVLDALDAGRIGEAAQCMEEHLDMIFHILEQLPEEYSPYVVE